MAIQITEEQLLNKSALITLNGQLNAASAPEVKARLKRMVESGVIQLVADLSGVSFIDSSGLAALVSGLKAVREKGGALKLAGLNQQALTVFKLTLLDRVFEFYPDAQAARKALS
ncbi:MAG: STAS domain-containing protein [Thermoflexales bacterium]|nr:STAS domain-containing protein [Thermoflexales bacterium]